jgi:hypothetical protein
MKDRSRLLPRLDDFWAKTGHPEKRWEKTMGRAIDQPHGPLRFLMTPFQQQTSVILDTGSSNLIIPSTFNEQLRQTQRKVHGRVSHDTRCDSVPINCDGSASVSFFTNSLKKPVWRVDSPAFSTRVYQLRASDWKWLNDTDTSPLLYDIVPAEPALRTMGKFSKFKGRSPEVIAANYRLAKPYFGKCVVCVRQGQRADRKISGFKEKVQAAAEFARSRGRPLDTNHFADKNGKGVQTVRCA